MIASLHDETYGEVEILAINYEDGILSYEYVPPLSQMSWKEPEDNTTTWTTWLKVSGNMFNK